MAAKNYYLILGVAVDATQDEIQRAYRRQVKDLHPDYYGQDSGPFLDLQEAYAVLRDPARRKVYDRRGLMGQERGSAGRTTRAGPDWAEPLIPPDDLSPRADYSLRHSFRSYSPSFEELFDRLWRNYSPARPEMEPLYSLNVEIVLTSRQALRGGRIRLLVPAQIVCPLCHGRGGIGRYECGRCHSAGYLIDEFPLTLTYPAGTVDNHVIQVSLDSFGIENFYLTVFFRVR